MESQTESSPSQEQQEALPQSSPDQQHLQSPELDSGTSQESSDAPEVVGTEESGESLALEAAQSDPELLADPNEAEAPTEEEAPEAPAPEITFDSFDDINVDSMPEEVKSYVQPIMSLVAQEVAVMKAEKESFESARKEFVDLIDAMESSGYDVKPLQTRIDEQNDFISSMSTDMIDTAWQAFNETHPEFENIPDNARELFSKELEQLYERHEGKTVLDRMNNAYSYSLWKAGVDKSSLTQKKHDSVSQENNKETKQPNEAAHKQAAIADGRIATSSPVRSLGELDWGEVLDRHSHLLDR